MSANHQGSSTNAFHTLVALTTSEPPRTPPVHLSNRIVMTPVSALTFEATIISI